MINKYKMLLVIFLNIAVFQSFSQTLDEWSVKIDTSEYIYNDVKVLAISGSASISFDKANLTLFFNVEQNQPEGINNFGFSFTPDFTDHRIAEYRLNPIGNSIQFLFDDGSMVSIPYKYKLAFVPLNSYISEAVAGVLIGSNTNKEIQMKKLYSKLNTAKRFKVIVPIISNSGTKTFIFSTTKPLNLNSFLKDMQKITR